MGFSLGFLPPQKSFSKFQLDHGRTATGLLATGYYTVSATLIKTRRNFNEGGRKKGGNITNLKCLRNSVYLMLGYYHYTLIFKNKTYTLNFHKVIEIKVACLIIVDPYAGRQ